MNAGKVLRENEARALQSNQFVSRVEGKTTQKGSAGRLKSWSAAGFIVAMILVFLMFFSSGNLIPEGISTRLIEETDMQYADAVESKKLVFQQAMINGDLPDNTVKNLQEHGVEVEGNHSGGSVVLKFEGRTITAENFLSELKSDVKFYNIFNLATYSRTAYYYDKDATEVFREIGTSRDNYTSDSDFDEVMSKLVGSGNNINVNNVGMVEETGEKETVVDYTEAGETVSATNAEEFVGAVSAKNLAKNSTEATLNSADTLKVADTISKERRSSLFFAGFMENIHKMKAGEGDESKINEAMNFLYESRESEVVDVKTGQITKMTGAALDSPSLYAILSGNKINVESVEDYSSDRILKTVENQLNASGGEAIVGTIASSATKVRGSIGRFISEGIEAASMAILGLVTPTISSSLVDNSFDTIKGINAGEFLVEGAVNVGKKLAKRSGGTAGDAAAVAKYMRMNTEILAMDAAADRLNRSPFDITSRNTFLGSIVYNIAVTFRGASSIFGKTTSIVNTVGKSIASLVPGVYADGVNNYLAFLGNCETYGSIGAVGSAQCSEITTFDTSTLNNPFGDAGFIAFVEENTTMENGIRKIKNDSKLGKFILYNNRRLTPLGVMDGGILESLQGGINNIPFLSNILSMIKTFLGASEEDKRIASGATFVNSGANPDWQTYKYAQRYVSLARATASLRQYSGGSTAYNNIPFFEGTENPVIAFTEEYLAQLQQK